MSRRVRGVLLLTGMLSISGISVGVADAQQSNALSAGSNVSAYDVSRETVLQGTVVSYAATSNTPPLGAHVIVQTASGAVDVHLGNARLLTSNHLSLTAGDSVKIVGENLAYGEGTHFFARVIEKGSQSVALRSTKGFPLTPMASKSQGGAL